MDCSHHCLPPILGQHSTLLVHSPRHGQHHLVSPLHDSILLQQEGGAELMLDAFIHAVDGELYGGEILELAPALLLRHRL